MLSRAAVPSVPPCPRQARVRPAPYALAYPTAPFPLSRRDLRRLVAEMLD